jgi:Spy/CpxP family protein refolding chaperone
VKLNWKKFGVAAAIGAALLTTAVVVFSQGPQGPGRERGFRHGPGSPGGPGGPGGPGPLADLNLTEDQKAQIKKINDSYRESDKALHEQMRSLHENQADPMSGQFNEAAVRQAAEARAKIQVELEVSNARRMSEIATILSAEQKAQLAERHQRMRRMGPPPPPPPPPDAPDAPDPLW